ALLLTLPHRLVSSVPSDFTGTIAGKRHCSTGTGAPTATAYNRQNRHLVWTCFPSEAPKGLIVNPCVIFHTRLTPLGTRNSDHNNDNFGDHNNDNFGVTNRLYCKYEQRG
ncbi:unnamed protein product, partial [Laminaria digitata]